MNGLTLPNSFSTNSASISLPNYKSSIVPTDTAVKFSSSSSSILPLQDQHTSQDGQLEQVVGFPNLKRTGNPIHDIDRHLTKLFTLAQFPPFQSIQRERKTLFFGKLFYLLGLSPQVS
jgi:hypothetical protein